MANNIFKDSGPVDVPYTGKIQHKFIIEDGRVYELHKVIVHQFMLSDVEDPDLYAAQPIFDWKESEMGKWVMSKAVETPEWHRYIDHSSFGYKYAIVAKLKDRDYTFWTMKWG